MSETVPTLITPVPRKSRALRKWALGLLTFFMVVLLHWLLFQGEERVPGVIVRPLGPCDIDWFEKKGGVLVLGCPHMDMLRLWPLPFEQPWWEDLPVRQGEVVF